MAKTYDQFCPIARGLDLLGERWTLLILRELAIGDQRFTDLRRTLVGIAPNLLSSRLDRLQADGLVEQAELAPPAARTVYRLTEEGQRAVPVIRAIGRFGGQHLPEGPPPGMPVRRSRIALLAPWATRQALEGQDSFVVEVDGERHQVQVGDGRTDVDRMPGDAAGDPPVLATTVSALVAARRLGEPLTAESHDVGAAKRFAQAFALTLA